MICLLNHRQKRSIENHGCGYQSSLKYRKSLQKNQAQRPISCGFGYSQTPENQIISYNYELLTDDFREQVCQKAFFRKNFRGLYQPFEAPYAHRTDFS